MGSIMHATCGCLSHMHVEMFSGKLGVQIQEQASTGAMGMDMKKWKS